MEEGVSTVPEAASYVPLVAVVRLETSLKNDAAPEEI